MSKNNRRGRPANVPRIHGVLCSPAEYLGHATVGDLQYARYVARPGSGVRQLDDLLPRRVRQRATVHVHPAQLVDAAVAGRRTTEQGRRALHHRSGRRRHVAVVRVVCKIRNKRVRVIVDVRTQSRTCTDVSRRSSVVLSISYVQARYRINGTVARPGFIFEGWGGGGVTRKSTRRGEIRGGYSGEVRGMFLAFWGGVATPIWGRHWNSSYNYIVLLLRY